jgi:hypothetical protein
MADYYPVLARAVSGLAMNHAETRQELYEHARNILVAQLRGRDPRMPASAMMHEQATLEAAIRRVEVESPSAQTKPSNYPPPRPMAKSTVSADDGVQTESAKRYDDISSAPHRANGIPDRLLAAAEDIVQTPVVSSAGFGTSTAQSAQSGTRTIPIVAISIGSSRDVSGQAMGASSGHPRAHVALPVKE